MVFIYHIEAHPRYLPLTQRLFERVEQGRHEAVSSILSLTEILTLPFRKREADLALRYRRVLLEYPHLSLLPVDPATAELAASVRAHYDLRTPDALQVAAALRGEATAFLTNDRHFARVRELEILLLNDFR